MPDEYITRREHDEFVRRMEDQHDHLALEDTEQNERIAKLEMMQDKINGLVVLVEKLAVNMEGMLRELTAQGNRLKSLEARDGENWRKVIGAVITGIVGAVLGFGLSHLGL